MAAVPMNEALLDASVRHQVRVLRFTAGEAARATALLDASSAEIVKRLESEDLTAWSEARLRSQLTEIRRLREQVAAEIQGQVASAAPDFASDEADWELAALQATSPVVVAFAAAPPQVLKTLAGQPINGVPLSGWLGQMVASDVVRMEQAIRLGIAQGETGRQMTARVMAVADVTRANAATIVRTSYNHVSNAAKQEVWTANADVLEGVRWTATLDGRTSPVCRSRDGQVYPVDKGPRPPAHPNCRSQVVPVVKGERIVGERPVVRDSRTRREREIDFRAEAAAAAGDKWKTMGAQERSAAAAARRAAWTAENVGTVPSNVTYDAWLRRQPKAFQDEVLGPARAKMFRDGETLDRFVDASGRQYTLAELRAATAGDKLNVLQPGVGLKAKALLQQGLSGDQVLAAIKEEFPDASTSAASIASYKSELKKAGLLDAPAAQPYPGPLKSAAAVAEVAKQFEAGLDPSMQQALGGQWLTLAESMQGGAPGAYAYYQAGKGVVASVEKLASIAPTQARQVLAHELGHLLHKQHQVLLSEADVIALKKSAAALSPAARKNYAYYLTHIDELTAEVYAQALSPSPYTSQGLLSADFTAAFGPQIEAARKALRAKFPVPSVVKPSPGGAPTMPFEVAGKHTGVGSLAKALLQQGMPDEQVLAAVKAQFPDAKTGLASIASYKSQLKKAGLLSPGSGPAVSVKAPAAVQPSVPAQPATVAKATAESAPLDKIASQPPATVAVAASKVKDTGLALMRQGLLDNGDLVSLLESLYPHNKVSPGSVSTWKSLWKKADPAGFAKAEGKGVKWKKAGDASGGPKPKLHGVQLGSKSKQVLELTKAKLNGAPLSAVDKQKLLDEIMASFGGAPNPSGAADLLELAQYEVATGKAATKPYLSAAAKHVPPPVKPKVPSVATKAEVDKLLEDAMEDLVANDGDPVDFIEAWMASNNKAIDPQLLAKAAQDAELTDLLDGGDLVNQVKIGWTKAQALLKSATPGAVDLTPSRLAASPLEGQPPPPRFTAAQRAAGLGQFGAAPNASLAKSLNRRHGLSGEAALTPEEAGAIKAYTGGIYRSLNDPLRRGEYASRPALQAYVDAAQHGLAKLPKYRGLSSRGVSLSEDRLKAALSTYHEGAVIEESAFVSSSTGGRAAFSGNLYFRIQGKRGVDVSSFSHYKNEREVLFAPGTRFRVDKVEKSGSAWVVSVTEVP